MNHSFVSYSQFGEDAIIRHYLPERICSYVDVGSNHPTIGNNTYSLYKRGGTGILIDPIISKVELSRKIRKRDQIVHAAVSNTEGSIQFYEFKESNFSTASEIRLNELAREGRLPINTYVVNLLTLKRLNLRNEPGVPYLLNIDVEGLDLQVLQGNDWNSFRPRVICVEDWQNPFSEESKVTTFLKFLNYKLVSRAIYSNIYVDGFYKSKFDN